jgi:hypothetical protein
VTDPGKSLARAAPHHQRNTARMNGRPARPRTRLQRVAADGAATQGSPINATSSTPRSHIHFLSIACYDMYLSALSIRPSGSSLPTSSRNWQKASR